MDDIVSIEETVDLYRYDLRIILGVAVVLQPGLAVNATVTVDPIWDTEGDVVGVDIQPLKALSYECDDVDCPASDPVVDPFTSMLIRQSDTIEAYARDFFLSESFAQHVRDLAI